jgi:hypothetical protein
MCQEYVVSLAGETLALNRGMVPIQTSPFG